MDSAFGLPPQTVTEETVLSKASVVSATKDTKASSVRNVVGDITYKPFSKIPMRSMAGRTDANFSASLRAGNDFENASGSLDVQETLKRTNCICSRSQSFTPTIGEDSKPVIEYFWRRNGVPRTPEATTVRQAGWSNALGLTSSIEIECICACSAKHCSRAY